MAQDVKTQLTALLQQALASVAPTATETPIHLERPRDPTHGDFATNLAMQLAKALKKEQRHREAAERYRGIVLPDLERRLQAAEMAAAARVAFKSI